MSYSLEVAHVVPAKGLGRILGCIRPPFPDFTTIRGGNYTFSNVIKRTNSRKLGSRMHRLIRGLNDRHLISLPLSLVGRFRSINNTPYITLSFLPPDGHEQYCICIRFAISMTSLLYAMLVSPLLCFSNTPAPAAS